MDSLEEICGSAISIVDDDLLQLVIIKHLLQLFTHGICIVGSQEQNEGVFILRENMVDDGWHHIVITQNDVMTRFQVMNVSFPMIGHSSLNGIGDDADDGTIEDEGTEDEGKTTDKQHPRFNFRMIKINAVECVRVNEEI